MDSTNCKAAHHKHNDWDSVISAAISSSFGGAVLGGHLYNLTGAIIGGAFGIIVELWPFLRLKNSHTHNDSLK
jgi:hypothetical protein